MADENRNRWQERSRTAWQQNRDNRSQQYDRSRDDYSSNYGYPQPGNRYGGEDYRSEAPYRSDSGATYRRNERRDDYSNLDMNRDRSSNMGSGYDPYDYGQTVGSFNQGKEGSYRKHDDTGYSDDRSYTDRDVYDSDYNRSYGRSDSDRYDSGSRYQGSSYDRTRRRDDWTDRDWDRERSGNTAMNHGKRDWWDRTTDEVASWFGDEGAERRREVDRRMGPHRGKGPKGYRRSDDRIRDDINDRLSDDSFIDASEIDITVENSEVVLSGTVDSREEKRRAEDIAERISGVANVENRLKVRSRDNRGGDTIYGNRD